MNDIAIDLTTLLPPTNSRAKQTTYKTKNGMVKPTKYRKSSSEAKKKFAEAYSKTDNGVKSVDIAYPDNNYTYGSKATIANRLLKNVEVVNHIEYQRSKLERIASHAVDRIEDHVESDDDNISLNASKFVIEQVHGKAMQKSSNVNFNFTGHVSDKAQDYGL